MGTPTAANPAALTFARRVRSELKSQKIGVRTLARRMAGDDRSQIEHHRRNLNRWLSGNNNPSTENRAEVADALGIPRQELAQDDEDEEAALAAELARVIRRHERRTKARA